MAWPTTTDTRVKSLLNDTAPPSWYWYPALWLKRSLALKRTVEQTCPPHVSGLLASQTDRRKTVACYVINTVIIKIRGVLDSVSLHVPRPGMVNQTPLWYFKIEHILYVQSAQGQKAKARLGFAGVDSGRESLNSTVEKTKRIQKQFFSSNADDEFLSSLWKKPKRWKATGPRRCPWLRNRCYLPVVFRSFKIQQMQSLFESSFIGKSNKCQDKSYFWVLELKLTQNAL